MPTTSPSNVGRKAAPATPWWVGKKQKEENWKKHLRSIGVKFAIGAGACKQRSTSTCISDAPMAGLRGCNNISTSKSNWDGWHVPRELRDRGASVGDVALYAPLLRKLSAGEPITLLALGSSVVGAHAGCTAPWPALRHCPCPRCCGSRCGRWGGDGWALKVLANINATWPHAGHRLYNLGEPGGDLMPTLLACPASYLSFQPDVVLLDFFTAYHGGASALTYERIVRMMLHGRSAGGGRRTPPPVVMFVNFFEFGDRYHARSTFTTMGSQLAAAHRGDANSVVSLWHSSTPTKVNQMASIIRKWAASGQREVHSTDVWRNWWRDQEVRALQLAYRLPAVWMFRAFGAEFEAHRYGLTAADYACYDGLHPNHDGRAETMVSDLVWSALRQGLEGAATLGADASYTPPSPLQTMPQRIGHLCFQFDAEGWEMLTGAKQTNRKLHEQSLMQTRQMPTIVVNDGWEFIKYEPDSRTPFKPGIVAHRPGARLHFEVNTLVAHEPSVQMQYLESHQGMGVVEVTCARCTCAPTRIDGARKIALHPCRSYLPRVTDHILPTT